MKTSETYRPAVTTDNVTYLRFTGPQRLCKAVHELEGILLGITADTRVNDPEMRSLGRWLKDHQEFRSLHPFSDVLSMLSTVIADGIVSEEELADLLWMCGRFSEDNGYYQRRYLRYSKTPGMLVGIAAGQRITKVELSTLHAWMEAHATLKTCWPYDELDSLLVHVLKDGVITAESTLHSLATLPNSSGRNTTRRWS